MVTWLSLLCALLFLLLIPLAPWLIRLRIRLMRWLNLPWAVRLLERHFKTWVLFLRIVLLVLAAILLAVSWSHR